MAAVGCDGIKTKSTWAQEAQEEEKAEKDYRKIYMYDIFLPE